MVLQSVARNVELPILALLNVVTQSAAVRIAAVRIAVVQSVVTPNEVTHAAVPSVPALIVATLSLVLVAVRHAVIHDVVPNVAAQGAAIQFWFQVVIRVAPIEVRYVALISVRYVAPISVLISVPYEARCVVVHQASRVHDVPHDLHDVPHHDSHVSAPLL